MGSYHRLRRVDVELSIVMRRADQKRGDRLMSVSELPSLLDFARKQTLTPYVDDEPTGGAA
ncbi:hypothetical protein [Cumulibacter soli]|uniref:hypothetical protein n=1 Tax=Cumulibacter soli TaxID=2546344 RepID=UPI001067CA80|nr:hypothetical protein [Cumulibacter soli]